MSTEFNQIAYSETGTRPVLADFLFSGWDRAIRAIRSLHTLASDWDGAGGRPVPPEKIASAVRFCQLMRDAGQAPPSTVYPLSEGNIMIEWRFPGGVVVRFEVEAPGRGQFMTTYPTKDGRKAHFRDYHWDADAPGVQGLGEGGHSHGCHPRPPRRRGCRLDPFQLAA